MFERMKKMTGYGWAAWLLLAGIGLLQLAACFPAFCDWYVLHWYRPVAGWVGTFMGFFPIAAGEILMYLLLPLLLAVLVFAFLGVLLRKKEGVKKACRRFFRGLFLAVLAVVFIYSANWVVPFRTSPLYFGTDPGKEYDLSALLELRTYVAEQLNAACQRVERDTDGVPVPPAGIDEAVVAAMQRKKEEFPLLDAAYPKAKPALCSYVLKWMGIGGYTYPYTMEVTYNRFSRENKLYYPCLLAHEYAHHMGYYRENEGNFISYITCISSEADFLQYAGYLEAYLYIQDACMDSLAGQGQAQEAAAAYLDREAAVDAQVFSDLLYFRGLANRAFEEEKNDFLEVHFSGAAREVAKTGWDTQAGLLGEANYDGVVELLLRYYERHGGL